MLSEPALIRGGGFAEVGGGFLWKNRPLAPAALPVDAGAVTGRTGNALDRIRGSVMERDRPALPSEASRVPLMDAGSGNRTVTGTGDHDHRRHGNRRKQAHPEHPPDGRDDTATRDADGLRRAARLVRGYLPKGTDFRKVTDAEVSAVQDRTDARPRKVLGYLTPAEAFRLARPP